MTDSAGTPDDPANAQPLKPRDAATLIIVDTSAGEPRVMMGKRRMDLVFMPGKYVFPGGRVDKADRVAPSVDELTAADAAKLLMEMRDTPSPGRARGDRNGGDPRDLRGGGAADRRAG